MGFVELLLIAVGLSMDAFAVSLCKGLGMKKLSIKNGIIIALFFGVFQAFMPVLGWFIGVRFEKYITNVDHWVAFILLGFIGVKMIVESFKNENETKDNDNLDIKELFILAIATSIDALAVGLTFAFLKISILFPVLLIGITTFVLSFFAVIIGNKFGVKYKSKAEFVGGVILVLIGTKILLEHLGVISF